MQTNIFLNDFQNIYHKVTIGRINLTINNVHYGLRHMFAMFTITAAHPGACMDCDWSCARIFTLDAIQNIMKIRKCSGFKFHPRSSSNKKKHTSCIRIRNVKQDTDKSQIT